MTDSSRVREEIQTFLSRESLLTLIAKKSLPSTKSSEEPGALAEGLAAASKTVTILYSSDTGHAEECAKAVARQCRNGGYAGSAPWRFERLERRRALGNCAQKRPKMDENP